MGHHVLCVPVFGAACESSACLEDVYEALLACHEHLSLQASSNVATLKSGREYDSARHDRFFHLVVVGSW